MGHRWDKKKGLILPNEKSVYLAEIVGSINERNLIKLNSI